MNFGYNGKIIFKNANIQIKKNNTTIILGLNGAGKSTLLKILTGNIKTSAKITNTFKNTFYLPQNPYYPEGIDTFEYLSSIFYKNNWKWFLDKKEKEKIENTLNIVGLNDKKDLDIKNLSGGEIQKANLALGLLSDADLFLLDEPASNMDLINELKLFEILKTVKEKGVTSVIISHDINLSMCFGDCFIGITRDGEIIQNTLDDFFTKENLNKIYGINFEIIKNKDRFYVQAIH